MTNAANFIYILLSIIGLLLTGGVWLITILLKYQRDSIESKHRAELTDITLSGNLKEQESQINIVSKEVELLENRLQKLESKIGYHHRVLWKEFPDAFKRGTDS